MEESKEAATLTVDVVARRIPARFGLNARRDIQVLAPMHRPAGAGALNAELQEALTPSRPDLPERRFGGRVFRVGDKVTQIRNNYDKGENGVFNGTMGVVTGLDPVEQKLTIRTDEDVDYEFGELDDWSSCQCCCTTTSPKPNGSTCPGHPVVAPIDEIVAALFLTEHTVEDHVERAKRKPGAISRHGLAGS